MIQTKTATILFGSTEHAVIPDNIRGSMQYPLSNTLVPSTVIFQHQVHGTRGIAINKDNLENRRPLLTHDSDYLITNLDHIGIGVLTADCVPIALIDPVHRAIGMVHAGWRGSVGGIAQNAINHMQNLYNTQPHDLQVFIGPCAHACCYTVNEEFIKQLPAWTRPAINQLQFDLLTCNRLALQECGVPETQIDMSHSVCTICNTQFHSHRRNPGNPARQPSIIWLH